MTPQTFRGRTLDEARQAARTALGPDAVVLTTRKVSRTGLGGLLGGEEIEVAAAPHAAVTPPPPAEKKVAPPTPKMPFSTAAYVTPLPDKPRAGAVSPSDKPRPSSSVPPPRERSLEPRVGQLFASRLTAATVPSAVEGELAALREAVERLQEPTMPRTGPLGRILRETGLEGKAAMDLVKVLKRPGASVNGEALRDALSDMVRVAPWPLAHDGPSLIALVGPTGVGKTTTAAKLAARAVHERGKSVTLVTCDGVRVGAFEQIERYAELLGVNVIAARTAADLQRAVASAETDVVIIDTSGKVPDRADGPERALRALPGSRGAARERSVLLCLPASIRADDASRFARAFAPTQPTAIAITKLDETSTPAGLVHGTIAAKLPVGILCFGQNVPEDISPATTGAILDYLLPKVGGRRKGATEGGATERLRRTS